jgi:hypothetical protein
MLDPNAGEIAPGRKIVTKNEQEDVGALGEVARGRNTLAQRSDSTRLATVNHQSAYSTDALLDQAAT